MDADYSPKYNDMTKVEQRGRLLFGVFSEEFGHGGFANFALGNIENDFFKLSASGMKGILIHFQKSKGGHCARSFIPVHEGVVLDDMEKIRGSHLEKVSMEILVSEAGLRHGDSGLQKAHVSCAGTSTVPFDLIVMDINDLFQREEPNIHRSVGQTLQHFSVPSIPLGQGCPEFFLTLGITHGTEDQACTIRGDREGGVAVNVQKIEHTPIDHQGQAVSMFGQMFNHRSPPVWSLSVYPLYNLRYWESSDA